MDSSQHHRPFYSPSSHEVFDRDGKVRPLIAERHPFKGVENYFTDSLLFQDSREMNENPQPEEPDSGNEADIEPKAEEEYF